MSVHGKFSRSRSFAVAGIALLATVGVAGKSTVSAWAKPRTIRSRRRRNYNYQQPTTQTPGYSYQQPYGSSSYPNIPPGSSLSGRAIPIILTGLAHPGHRIIPLGHHTIRLLGMAVDWGGWWGWPGGIPVGGAAGAGVGCGWGWGRRCWNCGFHGGSRRRICRLPRRRLPRRRLPRRRLGRRRHGGGGGHLRAALGPRPQDHRPANHRVGGAAGHISTTSWPRRRSPSCRATTAARCATITTSPTAGGSSSPPTG